MRRRIRACGNLRFNSIWRDRDNECPQLLVINSVHPNFSWDRSDNSQPRPRFNLYQD
jgi:hypothetical protein